MRENKGHKTIEGGHKTGGGEGGRPRQRAEREKSEAPKYRRQLASILGRFGLRSRTAPFIFSSATPQAQCSACTLHYSYFGLSFASLAVTHLNLPSHQNVVQHLLKIRQSPPFPQQTTRGDTRVSPRPRVRDFVCVSVCPESSGGEGMRDRGGQGVAEPQLHRSSESSFRTIDLS